MLTACFGFVPFLALPRPVVGVRRMQVFAMFLSNMLFYWLAVSFLRRLVAHCLGCKHCKCVDSIVLKSSPCLSSAPMPCMSSECCCKICRVGAQQKDPYNQQGIGLAADCSAAYRQAEYISLGHILGKVDTD